MKFPSPNIVQLQEPGNRRRRTASLNSIKPYTQDDKADGEFQDPGRTPRRRHRKSPTRTLCARETDSAERRMAAWTSVH